MALSVPGQPADRLSQQHHHRHCAVPTRARTCGHREPQRRPLARSDRRIPPPPPTLTWPTPPPTASQPQSSVTSAGTSCQSPRACRRALGSSS